jgi:acyl-CoA thioester hydrolase
MTIPKPIELSETVVRTEWLDYNGHMNDAAYATVFSRAVDIFMDHVALDAAIRRATGHTLYTVQNMIHYFKEAHLATPLSVSGRILEFDRKRVRLWLEMIAGPTGPLLAASEQLLISIDQSPGPPRVSNWPPMTLARLEGFAKTHAQISLPAQAGQGIRLSRRL